MNINTSVNLQKLQPKDFYPARAAKKNDKKGRETFLCPVLNCGKVTHLMLDYDSYWFTAFSQDLLFANNLLCGIIYLLLRKYILII